MSIRKINFYTFAKFYLNILDYLAKYTIPFKGLKDGKHELEFTFEPEFFTHFQTEDAYQGKGTFLVRIDKKSLVTTLEFELHGKITVACDRCLEKMELDVEGENKLFVKFGEEHQELADDVIVISDSESEIRIAHYIYELFSLSLPLSFVHPEDEDGNSTCNEKMLNKLSEFSIPEEEEQIDPRWSELKKLIDK